MEGVDDLRGPWPSGGESKVALPSAADQAGGYVQHEEPQRLRLNLRKIAVEGEQPEPGDQVCGNGDDLDPGLVDGVLARGQPAQPGVLSGLDPVLDAGMARCRASRNASCPVRVLVAKAW